jgi:hypothetical protein
LCGVPQFLLQQQQQLVVVDVKSSPLLVSFGQRK